MKLNDGRVVYINGKRVEDVLSIDILNKTYGYIQKYYELQKIKPSHTFEENNIKKSVTFLKPKTIEDLRKKRDVYYDIAKESFGMLGRTPDFLNPGIMSLSAHSSFLGQNEYTDFSLNAKKYYKYISENDLFVSHASINVQIDRSKTLGELNHDFAAVKITGNNDKEITVNGSKMIVTLSPLADELLIFNMPGLKQGDELFAVAFAIPVNTPGVKIISRKMINKDNYSEFDYPLSNSLEEIDAYVIFENVKVPWERVFVYKDINISNRFFDSSKIRHHTGHQDITRGIVKLEFITGVAIELAEKLGLSNFINIQEKLGYLTSSIELIKAGISSCEEEASYSEEGVLTPEIKAIQAVRYNLPFIYKKAVDLIQELSAGSMLSVPTELDLMNENKTILEQSLSSDLCDARYRIKLLNLAWDLTGEAFGQRQKVYEYYHAGDPMRIGATHYLTYPKKELTERVSDLLDRL
ncbi:4-hydroxyphenylacetate 3-hydroxylase family protein [Macrococcus bovicus]|uniref:4-hydroxyphenylacetate 3-hydroxylase family protein n=1 Tax=Macrococcus bovicus TaxID=69968 RepID=UPI0025A5A15F|nr:4-hydroxyphenylacetate 3-hydroxylase N-terminal domain-containing protein [Macrococcus bovicus]WJP96765.1 4-hydroxyphenylacetate 3-hydroxylase N-terminal domain-containing protein [Macrococcus bovicus]